LDLIRGVMKTKELRVSRSTFAGDILSVVFQNLTKLLSLHLSECSLEFIPKGTFLSLKVLNVLNLSKNKLLDLQTSMLIPLSNLISLDLNFNQFKVISDNSIRSLPSSLAKVDLSGNPFDCSCWQIIFLLWVQQQKDNMTALISETVLGILCPNILTDPVPQPHRSVAPANDSSGHALMTCPLLSL
uniref:LRRCT domain-containing protein n=1 Tax=Xenopus tropicalis TaxID=8364 RepID=A0A6I8SGJ3_XENTR